MRSARVGWWSIVAASASLLLGGAPRARAQAAPPATHVLIVVGIGGEPRFDDRFHTQSTGLAAALVDKFGVPRDHITVLAPDPARDSRWIKAKATKGEISTALAAINLAAAPDDRIVIVMFGHGSGIGADSKINISGPDLSAAELARELATLGTREIAIINTASASGDFTRALGGPHRVIITSTASAQERNETIFGEHFVAAFTGDAADADKDRAISLLEAYRYAQRETQRQYERDNRLPTEHARLEDNGDGTGVSQPDGVAEGKLAQRIAFGGSAASRAAAGDPVLAKLLADRKGVQDRLDSLRSRKATMAADAYENQLETLLVRLAEIDKAVRMREGSPK